MSERKVYHVQPTDNGWEVKAEGAKHASKTFETKQPAIEAGRDLAKNAPLGQLKIHRDDKFKTIQTEYTYGKDPRRYPG